MNQRDKDSLDRYLTREPEDETDEGASMEAYAEAMKHIPADPPEETPLYVNKSPFGYYLTTAIVFDFEKRFYNSISIGSAIYFREGDNNLHTNRPTYFPNSDKAIEAGSAVGFIVHNFDDAKGEALS